MRTAALLTAVLSYLPSLTTAQNNVFNETAYLTCPYASMDLYNTTGSVNSTGRVGFRFGDQGGKLTADEYYLSVTFDERRTPNTKYGTYKPEVTHYTHSWLSVPRYLRGNACVYHLQPQNASASGTGMNGCEGVLSQKCYDAILNKKINLPSANDEKQRCSAFYVTKEMEEECGNMFDFDSSQGPWASANGKCPKSRHIKSILYKYVLILLSQATRSTLVTKPARLTARRVCPDWKTCVHMRQIEYHRSRRFPTRVIPLTGTTDMYCKRVHSSL
jgi:hypothetical protein